jgi:hypothetical protein
MADWPMAAGLPRTLRAAGFRTAVLAMPGSLIRRSAHADRFLDYSRFALRHGVVIRAIRDWDPAVVVPCDDDAVELLCRIRQDVARRRPWMVPGRVRRCLDRSIGSPAAYPVKRGRVAQLEAFQRAGIRTPAFSGVASAEEAEDFAGRFGYPVVLKSDASAAGQGVRICRGPADLKAAFGALRSQVEGPRAPGGGPLERLLFGTATPVRRGISVQKFVKGREAMRLFVARDGEELGGISTIKFLRGSDGVGPATVVDFVDVPEMAEASRKLARTVGHGGFGSLDFLLEEETGRAYAIELNSRLTAIAHLGPLVGVDLGGMWRDSLEGRPVRPARFRAGGRVALFPREWMRDPSSIHLRECYVDAPREDPELLRAMIAWAEARAPQHGRMDLSAMQADPAAVYRQRFRVPSGVR